MPEDINALLLYVRTALFNAYRDGVIDGSFGRDNREVMKEEFKKTSENIEKTFFKKRSY